MNAGSQEHEGQRGPDGAGTSQGGTRYAVGVAGWSYPDWKGTVYPAHSPRDFSTLRWVAEHFDCIEINTSFYRDVPPDVSARWARQVEDLPAFVFTAKTHRDLTHAKGIEAEEIRRRAHHCATGLEPLREAGRLGGLVVQFPWYFDDTPEHRERLRIIAGELTQTPVFVELRHRSFLSTESGGGLPFLEALGLDFVNIDLPAAATAPALGSVNTGRFGYFRLHGRNSAAWFDRDAGRDQKYDYLYTIEELLMIAPSIRRVAARTETTYVITNNHFRGQAAANALQLAGLLGLPVPEPPQELQREFPFLAASTSSSAAEKRR